MRKEMLLWASALLLFSGCSKSNLAEKSVNPLTKKMTGSTTLLSGTGDVVGKITVGYQGWFGCAGDNSPYNSWTHQNLECWPDVRQYTTTYAGDKFNQAGVQQAAFNGNLGNGQPAKMFSSYDQSTVNVHFLWMQQNGIDCAALQRFGGALNTDARDKGFRDGMATRVQNAAQTYGRKFYIMYDISGWTNFQTEMKTDWTSFMSAHTTSSAYAKQNGKPVVCIWGIGFANRPGNVTSWSDVINWFKSQGCYVIVGAPGNFSTDTANQAAYNLADMLMPWRVGATTNFQTMDANDLTYCNAHNIDYQTDIYPGTAFYNSNASRPKNEIPRVHGDFMWSQFAGAKNANVSSVYISMFDEMNEATSILNCAEDASSIPAGNYFLTLDADGTHVSSDFYLRLVNDGGKMIKGQIAYTASHPTPHVLTPPASLTPHVLSSSSIQINWSQVADAPVYNIKRATVSGGPYTTVAAGVTGGTYTNTGLTANTTYYYVISAGYINGGESTNSGQVSGKTNP
ncbi:glycoside hydrolase family 71/99-like protein [Mucilaginibacter jinjuensis]|uniref:Fibronectin type-III domain-containing protein n=1 Tax=Mucilaginibacter jinjuensis TaxID=1176721 RepID=A0ABY7T265_9SPHI|nr:hypothetical protein [Mucilaginibacter jinjuensis]WCT10421.1 hypothetical protein PQO05_16925 [Mucilaginibacter jinjuensis]